MNHRKGQGAMEYLMTYGWAILVVMIVGIVMWELGIFNMGSTSMTTTGFSKIKPQLAGTGLKGIVFTGVFTNGVGTRISLSTGTATLSSGVTCASLLVPSPTTPGAGENFRITGNTCTTGGVAGDVYALTVSIPYTVAIGTITTTHTETGVIRGPQE